MLAAAPALAHDNSLDLTGLSITEGDAAALTSGSVKVYLDRKHSGTVSFSWKLVAQSATSGVDFVAATGTLIDSSSSDQVWYVPVQVIGDWLDEPNETFRFEVYNRVSVPAGETTATVTLLDNDQPIQVAPADISFDEGNGSGTKQVQFTISITNPGKVGFFLEYEVREDEPVSASAGSDFQPFQTGAVYINGTDTSKKVTVDVMRDNVAEPDETFVLALETATAGPPVQIVRPEAWATIRNDDAAAPTEVSIGDASVVEGHSGTRSLEFPVALSAPAPLDGLEVTWETRPNSAASGIDFVAATGTLNLPSGASAGEIVVSVLGDTLAESDEELEVRLLSVTSGTLNDPKATGTIVDDDKISLSVLDQTVSEGDTDQPVTVEVRLSGPASYPIQVEFTTGGGSATSGSDYLPLSDALVTLAPGQLSAFATVTVIGDQEQEPTEDVGESITCAAVAHLSIANGNATLTIVDVDVTSPQPTLAIGDVSLAEGNSGSTFFVFTIDASKPAPAPITVWAATEDGSANNTDYDPVQGTVTNPAGSSSATLSVVVSGDTTQEGDETFSVVLSNSQGATLADDRARGTVTNDDSGGTGGVPLLRVDDAVVVEGDQGSVQVSVGFYLSAAATTPVSVEYELVDRSATSGADYTAVAGQIVFSPGQTSAVLEFEVIGDTEGEDDEAVELRLHNAVGLDLARTSSAITILDDDQPPSPGGGGGQALPVLSIDDTELVEGPAGVNQVVVVVRADRAPPAMVRAAYRTVDATASAEDEDFVPHTGEVVLKEGQTTQDVTITINGDVRFESDEAFGVELFDPINATLGDASATVTIRNDDHQPLPTVYLAPPATAGEGDGRLVVPVRLSIPATRAVEALAWVEPGTALADVDYTPTATRLRWAPGESEPKKLRVALLDDRLVESSETVRVVLRLITLDDAFLGTHSAQVAIVDDDGGLRLVAETTVHGGRAGAEVDLRARVLDAGDRPVAAAMVSWASQAPLRLANGERTASDAQGTVNQRVRLGLAGRYRVVAALEGSDQQVEYSIVVAGALADLFDPRLQPNEHSVAGALDGACLAATGEMGSLCGYLFALPEGQQREAVVEITPGMITTQGDAAVQATKVQVQNVNARQAQLRAGARGAALGGLAVDVQGDSLPLSQLAQVLRGQRGSVPINARVDQKLAALRGEEAPAKPANERVLAEQGESRVGFFVNGRLSVGEHERTSLEPGYELTTGGLTSGVDYRFADNLFAGVAVGYLDAETRLRAGAGKLASTGYSLTLYTAWQRSAWWVDAAATLGRNDLDLLRTIYLPAPFNGQTRFDARGQTNTEQRTFNLGVGYDTHVRALEIGGFARGLVTTVDVDPYTETGAGALNVAIGGQQVDSSEIEAGVELAYPVSIGWGALHPLLRLSYLHELDNDARAIGGGFDYDVTDQEFIITTDAPDRDYFNLALGFQLTLRRSRLFYFTLDTDLAREDLDQYTLSLGYRQQF